MSLIGLLLVACSGDSEKTMTVNGSIKGLKKGKLYLQQLQDTVLVTLDSLEVQGSGDFSFKTDIESPDIYYLYLVKNDYNDINDRIIFFGEPGVINIKTTWNAFDFGAEITGSKTHEKLEEYNKGMSRYNKKNLELLQLRLDPKIKRDSTMADSLIKLGDKNIYRSYAYALNFALNNKDSYIAPYIAINEVADANVKYLDSIYNTLSPEVAGSKYGKKLEAYLKDIKSKEE